MSLVPTIKTKKIYYLNLHWYVAAGLGFILDELYLGLEIFLIYEILECDYEMVIEKSLITDKEIVELIELCIDYKNSNESTVIEKKIITFKL